MKLVAFLCVALVVSAAETPRDAASDKNFDLLGTTTLQVAADRTLQIQPGIRYAPVEGGYSLSTYDGRAFALESGSNVLRLSSPAILRTTETGGAMVNGMAFPINSMSARLLLQDDTDTNLKSMQESAKKLKTKNTANQDASQQPGKKLKYRYLFAENPNPTAELFSQQAIQQLTHLSPIGF